MSCSVHYAVNFIPVWIRCWHKVVVLETKPSAESNPDKQTAHSCTVKVTTTRAEAWSRSIAIHHGVVLYITFKFP